MNDVAAVKELQDLTAAPRILEIHGRRLELRPPKPFSDEFPKILKLVAPIGPHFASETPDVLGIVAAHGDRVRPLCALLTGADEAWLKDLEWEETIKLVSALIEENLDFFARRVVPALGNAMSGLVGKWSTMSPTTPTAPSTAPAMDSAGPTQLNS